MSNYNTINSSNQGIWQSYKLLIMFLSIFLVLIIGSVLGRNNLLKKAIDDQNEFLVKYAFFFGAKSNYLYEGEALIYRTLWHLESEKSKKVLSLCLAEYEIPLNKNGENMLTQALINKQKEFAKIIVDINPASIAEPNSKGIFALYFCGYDTELIKLLVKKGSTFLNIDNKGNSVFHLYGRWEQLEIFKEYKEHWVNQYNDEGLPPLIVAIKRQDTTAVANLVQLLDADPNIKDAEGKTAMSHAAELGETTEIITFVRRMGGDVNLQNSDGSYPIFHTNTERMFNYLVRNGAIINGRDNDGANIVHYLVENPIIEDQTFSSIIGVMDYVLINTADNNGKTAIMYAAQEGKEAQFLHLMNKYKSSHVTAFTEELYGYAKLGKNARIIREVENMLPKYTASYADDIAYQGIKRITKRRVLLTGLGRFLSRTIGHIGGILLAKDLYELMAGE